MYIFFPLKRRKTPPSLAFAVFPDDGDFPFIKGDSVPGLSRWQAGLCLATAQPAWPAEASSPLDKFLFHLGGSGMLVAGGGGEWVGGRQCTSKGRKGWGVF